MYDFFTHALIYTFAHSHTCSSLKLELDGMRQLKYALPNRIITVYQLILWLKFIYDVVLPYLKKYLTIS